jgi:hypothetical protein
VITPESPVVTPVEPKEPIILLHALSNISSPQTLKLKGYIKHRQVVVLIDSGSTHNFIHRRIIDEIHCFVFHVSNFQILIANGGTMKCGGCCENFKLQMSDYHLKTHMFSISMGGCDIFLRVEWIRTLGPIIMVYQELYMSFTQDAHPYTLRGLQAGSPKIIISHRMEKMLNKGHYGVISQFNSIQVTKQTSQVVPPSLQLILDKYPKVFEVPTSLPPFKGEHDHSIPLLPGSQPLNVRPYRYQFAQKNEIENMVKELLEVGVIHPSTNPYSSPVVMVLKKEVTWRMYPNFHALNKLNIKDKFPIPVIDDLLDELQGVSVFTKLEQ